MLTYCDVTDLVRTAEKLEKLATTDSMTGLYNRRHFLDLAQAEWSRFQRYHHPLSVLMIDIDHFKEVNDAHGHLVGDEVLKALVTRVQPCLRRQDLLTRHGGVEFCVVLPGADLAGAQALAERIRVGVCREPIDSNGVRIPITVSIGVAVMDKDVARSRSVLLETADRELYRAKGAGRNRVSAPDAG